MDRKWKVLLGLLFVLLLLGGIMSMQASAAIVSSGACGDNATWSLSDSGVLTISGTGDVTTYPAPWDGYRSAIKRCIVSEGITGLHNRAFYKCKNLTSVTLPKTLKSIGAYSFDSCTSLTSIRFHENLREIQDSAFSGCTALDTVHISDIASWCEISFANVASSPWCNGGNLYLNNVLVTDLLIPEGVTSISAHAFYGCSSLASVTISKGVTYIGNKAFGHCSGMKEISMPSNLNSIGVQAFAKCTSLTNVEIPAGVKTIGKEAFWYCSKLRFVTIPVSVNEIGDDAFTSCSVLKYIAYGGTEKQKSSIRMGVISSNVINATWLYGARLFELEGINYVIYNTHAHVLEADVDSVDVKILKKVENVSVTSIGVSAFKNCANLIGVTIPESVTSIGASAFENCANLTGVTIPESVTSIGASAFGGCVRLASITIPEGITSIESYTFYECKNLSSIAIPESVRSIGLFAFSGCDSLADIIIPEGVTSIEHYAFYECTGLERIMIPASVMSIGDEAFSGCNKLEEAVFNGTQEMWSAISIGVDNEPLTNANIHFNVDVTGIVLEQTSITLLTGTTVPLTATIVPENATNKKMLWTTSDANVATVENGVVTAVGAGTAIITVSTEDGNASATCTVVVMPKQKNIEITNLTKSDKITFTANLTSADHGILIVARYGENGKYIGMNIYNAADSVPVNIANDCAKISVMWWDGFFTMQNLAPVVELDI